MDNIQVSVCISAYNHEDFIEDALNSVLDQSCDFEYEVILSNDTSTDHTHQVIENYIATHPKAYKIRYYNQQKNLGINYNLIFTLEKAEGKYIALLEGDDYWLDKNKLQKQFEFMENNPHYTLCSAAYRTTTLNNETIDRKLKENVVGKTYIFETIKDFSPNYLNMFFRKETLDVEKLKDFKYSGDNVIFLMCLSKGKVYFFNEIFAFRRTHPNSAWTARTEIERKSLGIEQLIGLYKIPKFKSLVRSSLFHVGLDLAENETNRQEHLWRSFKLIRNPTELIYFAKVILHNLLPKKP